MSIISKTSKRAFTLVELLVVVIIIAILAAIAIPKFTNATLRSKESSLRSELKMLRNGVELFKSDIGGYPLTMNDLAATTPPLNYYNQVGAASVSVAVGSWRGPYVSNVDNDPISNTAFAYAYQTGTFTASSSDPTSASDGSNYQNW